MKRQVYLMLSPEYFLILGRYVQSDAKHVHTKLTQHEPITQEESQLYDIYFDYFYVKMDQWLAKNPRKKYQVKLRLSHAYFLYTMFLRFSEGNSSQWENIVFRDIVAMLHQRLINYFSL